MLSTSDLFRELAPELREKVADLADRRVYEEGDTLYEMGDAADSLFLLHNGRVRFGLGVGNRPDSGGSVMFPGSVIGWAALVEENPRRVATSVCLEDSVLYSVPGKEILALFEDDPRSGYRFMRRLAMMITRDFMSVMSV